jgi:hypothetical protein
MRRPFLRLALLMVAVARAGQAQIVSVTADTANLRADPNAASPVVLTLSTGALVEVVDKAGDHYRVKTPQAAPPAGTVARPAAGPARPVVVRRGLAWFNAGYQPVSNKFSSTVTFTRYAEQGTVTTPYPVKSGLAFEGGGGARVWRDLVVGAAVSRYSTSGTATVSARIPHPFFFNTFRDVQGTSPTLTRSEVAVHAFAMWMLAPSDKMQVGVFGGPSYVSVTQTLVTGVDVTDTYPYDTAAFSAARAEEQSKSNPGFNAGADFTYLLGKQVGVGASVRFSRASIPFKQPDGQTLSTPAGGLQVGGGIRLRF